MKFTKPKCAANGFSGIQGFVICAVCAVAASLSVGFFRAIAVRSGCQWVRVAGFWVAGFFAAISLFALATDLISTSRFRGRKSASKIPKGSDKKPDA
jgi:hypothetical protein